MPSILITGCSSGYGLETANLFHANGWNVIATMRTPQEDILPKSDRIKVLALDVTDPQSIAAAIETCGPIDALVNNAGIGLFGAFEATPMSTIREIFATNTFGSMAMVQAVLPQFRSRKSGTIVNVTSSAVLAPMPLVAAYSASKTAVEGFTASLELELRTFDIRIKLVQPGYCPDTQFSANTGARIVIPEAYSTYAQDVFTAYQQPDDVTTATDVADTVWLAVNDTSDQLRFPAGADARKLVGVSG